MEAYMFFRVLTCIAALILGTQVQGGELKTVDGSSIPNTGNSIESFENGEIRNVPDIGSYLMVLRATDNVGQFWLQCQRKSALSVAIRMDGQAGRGQLRKGRAVSVSADDTPSKEIQFVVFEDFVAVADVHEGKNDESAVIFLDALSRA